MFMHYVINRIITYWDYCQEASGVMGGFRFGDAPKQLVVIGEGLAYISLFLV